MTRRAELLFPAQTELGECPVWDAARDCLFFMDVSEKRLHRLDWRNRALGTLDLPAIGGGLVLGRDGALIAGLQTGLHRIDPERGTVYFLVDPEPDRPDNRLNEAKCDPQGRLWIGSMSTRDRLPCGRLYRMERDGRIAAVLDGIIIPNALVWTGPQTMLFADSARRLIWSFRCDPETGALSERRVWADCSAAPGMPDGIALDAEGCLWNAEFGGGRIVRYDPAGRPIETVPLPATQVTTCAFAGEGLRQLVVVTTKRLLDARGRQAQSHAGDLFVIEPPAPGAPVPLFG